MSKVNTTPKNAATSLFYPNGGSFAPETTLIPGSSFDVQFGTMFGSNPQANPLQDFAPNYMALSEVRFNFVRYYLITLLSSKFCSLLVPIAAPPLAHSESLNASAHDDRVDSGMKD
jgi:hypothetical protein